MKVLILGGSKNIGYLTAVRLLNSGATVTLLLRSPPVFDEDVFMKEHIKSGRARLVKGDGLIQSDVQRAWDEAAKASPFDPSEGSVDFAVFSVGATSATLSLTKGIIISPVNLVTQCLINLLCTMPKSLPLPKLITISSTGLTPTSHKSLPLPLKPLYGYMLAAPHRDKVGAERAIAHCAGWSWNAEVDGEPSEEIMGSSDWTAKEGMPLSGMLKENVVVIRPALLTNGECKGDAEAARAERKEVKRCSANKVAYRVKDGELGGWTISRKDVAHFLVEGVIGHWEEYQGKCMSIAY